MNFEFTEREEGFRKEVRAWLERNLPGDLRGKAGWVAPGIRGSRLPIMCL